MQREVPELRRQPPGPRKPSPGCIWPRLEELEASKKKLQEKLKRAERKENRQVAENASPTIGENAPSATQQVGNSDFLIY